MASHSAFDYSQLTIAERLQLVEELWDSIAADADAEALPLTDAERALVDERLDELRAHPDAGRPWADIRAEILGKPRR
ncbi:MAG: addiction module protein [Gemmatimonadaceae bacterium]